MFRLLTKQLTIIEQTTATCEQRGWQPRAEENVDHQGSWKTKKHCSYQREAGTVWGLILELWRKRRTLKTKSYEMIILSEYFFHVRVLVLWKMLEGDDFSSSEVPCPLRALANPLLVRSYSKQWKCVSSKLLIHDILLCPWRRIT